MNPCASTILGSTFNIYIGSPFIVPEADGGKTDDHCIEQVHTGKDPGAGEQKVTGKAGCLIEIIQNGCHQQECGSDGPVDLLTDDPASGRLQEAINLFFLSQQEDGYQKVGKRYHKVGEGREIEQLQKMTILSDHCGVYFLFGNVLVNMFVQAGAGADKLFQRHMEGRCDGFQGIISGNSISILDTLNGSYGEGCSFGQLFLG